MRGPTLRELVRAALAAGETYGLAIVDHIRANPSARWWHRFGLDGRIYPLLHRMEDDGELTSYLDPAGSPLRGGIPRRCYRPAEKS